jgi:hypothetical protein
MLEQLQALQVRLNRLRQAATLKSDPMAVLSSETTIAMLEVQLEQLQRWRDADKLLQVMGRIYRTYLAGDLPPSPQQALDFVVTQLEETELWRRATS